MKTNQKKLWKQTSDKIRLRDNYKCQVCIFMEGNKDKVFKPRDLNVHHIIPEQFEELRFDELNLITLCASHHKWGKYSAHLNAIWWTIFLKEKFTDRYEYLIKKTASL